MIHKNYFFHLNYFFSYHVKNEDDETFVSSVLACVLHKMSFKAVVLCSRAGTAEKCRRKVRCTYGTERFLFVFFFSFFDLFLCLKFSYAFRENLCPN